MRGEILVGRERRRRWWDEQKPAIVTEAGVEGARVTQVAQRHEITRQQIYAWRHELKLKSLLHPDGGAFFLPVDVAEGVQGQHSALTKDSSTEAVEIVLSNGRRLCVSSRPGDAALSRLIRLVEAA